MKTITWVPSSLILAAALSGGCASKERAEQLKQVVEQTTQIRDTTNSIWSASFAQFTTYTLTDIGDERRNIGRIYCPRRLDPGDRIFLSDDMWDVKTVKNYGAKTTEEKDDTQNYKSDNVELLVMFAGKAKIR